MALAKSKLNTIDTSLSSALNNSKISHKEFFNIITEKNIYENTKENIKEIKEEKSTAEPRIIKAYRIIKIILKFDYFLKL